MKRTAKIIKNNKGYSLVEILLAVAIIAILAAVGVGATASLIKSSRQKSLDKMAETLFIAAERNIQAAVIAGKTEQFGSVGEKEIRSADADELKNIIVPDGAVDSEISMGKWLISYNVSGDSIHAVEAYFTTKNNSFADSFDSFDAVALKSEYEAKNGTVGYYGGGGVDSYDILPPNVTSENVNKHNASVKVFNNEELGVMVRIGLPKPSTTTKQYYGSLADGSINANDPKPVNYVLKITGTTSNNTISLEGELNKLSNYNNYDDPLHGEILSYVPSEYAYYTYIPLDNLKAGKFSDLVNGVTTAYYFRNVTKITYNGEDTVPADTSKRIVPGEDIVVEASAVCVGEESVQVKKTNDQNQYQPQVQTNSLFERRVSINLPAPAESYDVVNVAYGRHLQNLSVLTSGIPEGTSLKVRQTKTIDFTVATGDVNAVNNDFWALVYPGMTFSPIQNSKIMEYDGGAVVTYAGYVTGGENKVLGIKNVIIQLPAETGSYEGVGLFALYTGSAIKNTVMDNVLVSGGTNDLNVGALAGRSIGTLEVSSCLVNHSFIRSHSADTDCSAGGMLGRATTVTMNKCFVTDSFVCSANGDAGGLVGTCAGTIGETDGCGVRTGKAALLSFLNAGGVNAFHFDIFRDIYSRLSNDDTTDDPPEVTIDESNVYGTVAGRNSGGLIGASIDAVTIKNSYASQTVISEAGGAAGGLIGKTDYSTDITTSYADCNLKGDRCAGLIADGNGATTVTGSYSAGFILEVTGTGAGDHYGAGLCGGNSNTITDSFSLINFDNVYEEGFFTDETLTFVDGYVENYPEDIVPMYPENGKIYALCRGGTVTKSYFSYGGDVEPQTGLGENKSIRDIVEDSALSIDKKSGSFNENVGGSDTVEIFYKTAYELADILKGKLFGDENDKAVLPDIIPGLPHYGDWLERPSNGLVARIYKISDSPLAYEMYFEYGKKQEGKECVEEYPGSKFLVARPDKNILGGTDADWVAYAPWHGVWNNSQGLVANPVRENIKHVYFTDEFCAEAQPVTMRNWFANMYNLESVDFNTLDTSKVQNMMGTFSAMPNTKTNKLTELDLRCFDTTSLKRADHMFRDCKNLVTIRVSNNFSFVGVGEASFFQDCEKLIGGCGTAWADTRDISKKFAWIDGKSGNTLDNNSTRGYFTVDECYGLWARIYDMGDGTLNMYFEQGTVEYHTGGGTLLYEWRGDNGGFLTETADGMNSAKAAPWYANAANGGIPDSVRTGITKAIFTDRYCSYAHPMGLRNYFIGMSRLQSIENITKLDVSAVQYMNGAFADCPELTVLDLSGWDTRSLKYPTVMFRGCKKLKTIYVSETFTMDAVVNATEMFKDCDVLIGGCGTAWADKTGTSKIDGTYAWIDGREGNPKDSGSAQGYFTNVEYIKFWARIYSNGEGKYSLYFELGPKNNDIKHENETFVAEWRGDISGGFLMSSAVPWRNTSDGWNADDKGNITNITFGKLFCKYARPTNTSYWFDGFSKLKDIENLDLLDTSSVTNMQCMFNKCSAINTIDCSNFDTKKVRNMSYMFADDGSLLTIFGSDKFTPDSLSSATQMFSNCNKLRGGEGTALVYYNYHEVGYYRPYIRLDRRISEGISGILTDKTRGGAVLLENTDDGITMHIFDIEGDEYASVKNSLESSGKLEKELKWFSLGGYSYESDYPWHEYRAQITEVVFHDKATLRPTRVNNWFSNCTVLKIFDKDKNFVTSSITDMSYLFNNCSSLEKIDLSHFNTERVTSMAYMFNGCSKIKAFDLTSFDTAKVTNMAYMFNKCTSAKEIDCSSFNTRKVTEMSYMFADDVNLVTIFGSEDTTADSLSSATLTFANCNKLRGGEGTTLIYYNYQTVSYYKPYIHLDRRISEGNPGIFTDKTKGGAVLLENTGNGLTMHIFDIEGSEYSAKKEELETAGRLEEYITWFNKGGYNSEDLYPWHEYRSQITEVVFHDKDIFRPTRMNNWFSNFTALTTFDAGHNFVSTEVSDMSYMFNNCSSLEEIDLSYFNTERVASMAYMFNGCSKFKTIDLTSFNTAKVTNMAYMFNKCTSVTEIDCSSFNTRKVTEMSYMFADDVNLVTIFGSEDTTADSLSSATLTFANCNKLRGGEGTTLIYYNYQTVSYYKPYIHLDRRISEGNPGIFTDKTKGGAVLLENTGNGLTMHIFDIEGSEYSAKKEELETAGRLEEYITWFNKGGYNSENLYPWHEYRSQITEVVFHDKDIFRPTRMNNWFSNFTALTTFDAGHNFVSTEVSDMSYMFNNCSSLEEIDLSYFNTERVTSMAYMFSGCSKFKTIDLTSFNTAKVTNMAYMFNKCTSVTEIDCSSFNTRKVTEMSYMFADDVNLVTIFGSEDTTADSLSSATLTFANCNKLRGGEGTTLIYYNYQTVSYYKPYIHLDRRISEGNPGIFTDKTKGGCVLLERDTDDGIIMHLFDLNGNEYLPKKQTLETSGRLEKDITWFNTGGYNSEALYPWHGYRSQIKEVIIHDGDLFRPTRMNYWFSNFTSLVTFDADKHLVTSSVSDMAYLFNNCSALTAIDLSYYNTARVTDMSYMFNGCRNITRIDATSFDTSKVSNMASMFGGCTALTEIDCSSFNTEKLTNISSMFENDSALHTVFMGDMFTANALTSATMTFGQCSRLRGGEGSSIIYWNYNTLGNYKPYLKLDDASQGGSSGIFTDKNRIGLAVIDTTGKMTISTGTYPGEWKTNNPDGSVTYAFKLGGYSNASSLPWDEKRNDITEVEFADSFTALQMAYWFEGCSNLATINLSNVVTTYTNSMASMFKDCTSLTTLDLSHLTVSSVKNMSNMFNGCSSLTTIEVDAFDISSVTSSANMFLGCSAIQGVGSADPTFVTTYDAGHVDASYAHINIKGNPGYFSGDVTETATDDDEIIKISVKINGVMTDMWFYNGVVYNSFEDALEAKNNSGSP